MGGLKEIKSVKLAPYTLISSSMAGILAFVYVAIIIILLGAVADFVPQLRVLGEIIDVFGVAMIIVIPIGAYFINLVLSFFTALLYNILAPEVGGIKMGLKGDEIRRVPAVSFALILAIIQAIETFIAGIFLAAAISPFTAVINNEIPVIVKTVTNATSTIGVSIPIPAVSGISGSMLAILLIIVLPAAVFIWVFISNTVVAVFYNHIAIKFSKITFEFVKISGTLHELKSIPVVPLAALAAAVVFAAFGFVVGLISVMLLALTGNPTAGNIIWDVIFLILDTLGYFAAYFLIFTLVGILYNFLASRIGGFELDLE
jgi:hypothetical protein